MKKAPLATVLLISMAGCIGMVEEPLGDNGAGGEGSAGQSGAGGDSGTGGAMGAGGETGVGGEMGSGGQTGVGGGFGVGGARGSGGAFGAGGRAGTGGRFGTGGMPGTGGRAGTGGTTAAVCTSMMNWSGATGSTMEPGVSCNSCHNHAFTIAGTVYPTAHEPNLCYGVNGSTGVRVVITGADGKKLTLTPSASGNFYSNTAVAKPFTAKVTNGSASRPMVASQQSGDCNSCHTQNGASSAPGRICRRNGPLRARRFVARLLRRFEIVQAVELLLGGVC